MAPQVLVSLANNILSLFLSPDDYLSRGHCATLHIEVECPAAVEYQAGAKYQPVRAWACDATVQEGQTRCTHHWFSHFWLYAQDGQPVAMASSTDQLAGLLQLSAVRVFGAVGKQPLQLPEGFAASAISKPQQQAQRQQLQQQQQQQQQVQQQQPAQPAQQVQQAQPKPKLTLSIPKLTGNNTVRKPCCTVMVMLEVGSAADFVHGPPYKVPYSWCCGREAGNKDFCKQHLTSRFVMLDRNLGVLATVNTLNLLAANLGYSEVVLNTEQPDLLQKLLNPSVANAAAGKAAGAAAAAGNEKGGKAGSSTAAARDTNNAGAAAAMAVDSPDVSAAAMQQQQQVEVGQKRNSIEAELPHPANPAKVAANGRAGAGAGSTAAAAGSSGSASKVAEGLPAVLRLRLTAGEAAEQRQALLQRKALLAESGSAQQQQQQQAGQYVMQLDGQQGEQQRQKLDEQQQLDMQLEMLEKLCGNGLDIVLPVSQGSSSNASTRCLGVTLQLGVGSLKDMTDASAFVRILNGRRCGHEGGAKRACKKHRLSVFTLLSVTGETLIHSTHLQGLAHRLKVSSAAILDGADHTPLPEYSSLPGTPTWRKASDSSVLTVWLPPDSKALPGNWQQKPCCGLDVYVDKPQTMQQAIGSGVSVMSVVKCGNEAGVRTTCKRHTAQGPLQLFSWSDSFAGLATLNTTPGGTALHSCSNLAQLAMWLGVGKVKVVDADSLEPLAAYTNLAIPPPVQLPLTLSGAQLTLSNAALAPPSIPGLLPGLGGAPGAGTVVAARAGSAAAAAVAAGVAAVRLEGAAEGDAAAAGGAAAGLVAMLTSAARAGGLAAVNLLGNSRVDVTGIAGAQQQQQQQGPEPAQQQQVTVHVEPRPVGGHQGRPCCMLHVVLLLEDKAAYTQGQQYPILFTHRCGNEAGNRSRCRQHADAAVRICVTDPASVQAAVTAQNLPAYALHSAKPALTQGVALAVVAESQIVAKANNSREVAAALGADSFRMLDGLTGEDLTDVANWSPTNVAGTAAKVAQATRDAQAAAAALAAVAAAGVPGVPNAQALLAALQGKIGALNAPLTQVQPLELDALAPAAQAAGGAQVARAAAAAAAAAVSTAPAAAGGGDADMADANAAAAGGADNQAAVQQVSAVPEQQQQQQHGDAAVLVPDAGPQAAPQAAGEQQPAAPAASGSNSGIGFGSSAPRHLQQWAVNFKPGQA